MLKGIDKSKESKMLNQTLTGNTEIYRADCFDENISKLIWCFNGI